MASDFAKRLRSSGAQMAGRDPEKYMTFLTVAQGDATADHIEALEAEVERLTKERNRLWSQREGLDCRYAGPYAETSGSHCPIDDPCLRCQKEKAERERDEVRAEVERLTRDVLSGMDIAREADDTIARLTADLAAARADPRLAFTGEHYCDLRNFISTAREEWEPHLGADYMDDLDKRVRQALIAHRAALAALPKEDDDGA